VLTTVTVPLALPAAVGSNTTLNVWLPPAPIVTDEAPEMLKPVPDTEIEETVRLAEPELLKVTADEVLLPTATLPNAMLAGDAVMLASTPVPVRGISSGLFATLLATEALPVKLPAADGANRTLNEALEPAATVTGEDIPETLKPEPVALTEETVRLAVPVLLSVTVLEVLLPALMLPKETLVGEGEIAPCVASPLNGMTSALAEALLKMETLPVTLPAVVGANTTLKVAALPAPTEIPPDTPDTLKPVPEAVIDGTERLAEPVFVRVTVCVVLLPVATSPNAMLAGDAEMPEVTPEPVKATVIAASDALLVNAMLPLAAPAAVGENSAVNVAVPPAARVRGTGAPEMEKPAPVVMACETVVDAVPEFLRMIVALPVAPTFTLPKLTEDGVAASAP